MNLARNSSWINTHRERATVNRRGTKYVHTDTQNRQPGTIHILLILLNIFTGGGDGCAMMVVGRCESAPPAEKKIRKSEGEEHSNQRVAG
ncbi:hypothetical protein B9Z55_014655 [Caenorhabditis nigoni]|uniref:Uncharacterized protein n=1 Tax=Caenorhabditis nigoni TaxID=1611254 RepID=A0A2G5U6Z0_9PELO|nr:hypothetical protein B9Z55_014655 [Caenorhabditis nigoni]